MVCGNCGHNASRLRIVGFGSEGSVERCERCLGISAAGGSAEGALSRQRVRQDAVKYEGDVLNPWFYEKSSRTFEPNPEFVKRHAGNAMNFYRPEDLRAYPKLKDSMYSRLAVADDVSHEGELAPAFEEAVREAPSTK